MKFLERTTYKEGYARTVAPVGAAKGAGIGGMAGLFGGALIAGFALDDPKMTREKAAAILGTTTLLSAVMGSYAGYKQSYAKANLHLAAHPELKQQEGYFLAKGIKPRLGLFAATFAFLAAGAVVTHVVNTNAKLGK